MVLLLIQLNTSGRRVRRGWMNETTIIDYVFNKNDSINVDKKEVKKRKTF